MGCFVSGGASLTERLEREKTKGKRRESNERKRKRSVGGEDEK